MGVAARIGVAAGLGLLSTIGGAWACALRPSPGRPGPSASIRTDEYSALVSRQDVRGLTRVALQKWFPHSSDDPRAVRYRDRPNAPLPSWVPAWTGFHALTGADAGNGDRTAQGAGWPLRALACEFSYTTSPTRDANGKWSYSYETIGGIGLPFREVSNVFLEVGLPLRPLWPGLLADSALFSLAWCLVLGVPRSIRRARRVRHTRCPRCGYDLRATGGLPAGCSECGWGRAPA